MVPSTRTILYDSNNNESVYVLVALSVECQRRYLPSTLNLAPTVRGNILVGFHASSDVYAGNGGAFPAQSPLNGGALPPS